MWHMINVSLQLHISIKQKAGADSIVDVIIIEYEEITDYLSITF